MLVQKFNIVPQGVIKSGSLKYQVDENTGDIQADEDIVAGMIFFTQEFKQGQNAKIDPSLLLSENIKPGMKFQAGAVSLLVTSIVNKVATVQVSVSDSVNKISASGPAHLNLSGKYWTIMGLTLVGSADVPIIGNLDLTIQLEPVA